MVLLWPLTALATEAICRFSEGRAAALRRRQHKGEKPRAGWLEAADVGVDVLPNLHAHTALPDLAQAGLALAFVAALVSRGGSLTRPFSIVSRLAVAHSSILWMRCFSIAATVTGLACPNYHAKGGAAGGLNGGRHDLMFSGHAAVGTLLAVFTAHVLRQSAHPVVGWACWAAAAANAALQVAVGDHYTADVLVANYVTIPVSLLILASERCY